MNEIWKAIPGHEGRYRVSDLGRVMSLATGRPHIMAPILNRGGYLTVKLCEGGAAKRHSIHLLVLAAFVGERPDGMVCRHMDGNPTNNRLDNLRYGTPSENSRDMLRHGTHNVASLTHCPNNHEYTPENTAWRRSCKTCERASNANRRARMRVA